MYFYLSINLSSFSDVSFKHPEAFKNHVKSKHEEKSEGPLGKTECPICKAIFGKTNLKKHIRTKHEGIKDYKCDLCGNQYFEKKRLNRHIKKEHDKIRDEKCNQCGKLYFSKDDLNQHIRNIHNKEQNKIVHDKEMAKCEFCGKGFTNKSMNIHIKAIHKGSRDHVCHVCKYASYWTLAFLQY